MNPIICPENKDNELMFGCLNVCGLKRRLHFPEFRDTLSIFDFFCVTETKLDHTDIITVPGYSFISQIRKQKFIRSSGGIAVFYKNIFEGKVKVIPSESDYILWLRIDHTVFNIQEDLILGVLYIPPIQSRFLNEDEFLCLESEITLMCSKSSYVCLTGDTNARTAQLSDFITADNTIADVMQFDQETLDFFNKSEMLDKLHINKVRVSQDNYVNTNGSKLIDICINNNLFILNGRCGKDKSLGTCTFRGQSLIDYTICSINCLKLLADFEVEDTDSLLSDGHSILKWSVCANLEYKIEEESPIPHKPFKNWDDRRIDDFKSNISTESLADIYAKLQPSKPCIDEAINDIANVFSAAAKTSFPVHTKNAKTPGTKPWFGPKCHQARKKYRLAKNKYRRFRNEYNESQLQQSCKQYKKVMNFYINQHKWKNANKLRQLHTRRPKDYWRYLNSLSKNKSSEKSPSLQEFFEHFRNINVSERNEDFVFEQSGFDSENADQILNSSITESELAEAINGLKLGKSPGYDEILNEHIKSTQSLFMPLYVKLFNIIFDTGILPDVWLEGKIRPIFKNKGDRMNPDNYRPITILSCFSKLFTSILNNRLTKFLEIHTALNENQAGFRQGYSTTDHIFTLNALIELFKSKKKRLFCTFIDFSKAFDTVWRIGLWDKLLEGSINGKMFRIIHNMYQGIKSSVSIRGEHSAFFACDCGVRQGENLSPILFSLYLNDLEHFLLHKDLQGITLDITDNEIMIYMRLFTLLYADDAVLMADNPDDMQSCLDAFSEYCQRWKLNINIAKTKIIIFGGNKRSNSNFRFILDNEVIEIVDKYKYLGVWFSQSGSFLNTRKYITQQAKKAMILLFTRINNLDIPLDLQLKLFDHTVLPILTYSCEVWGYENLDIIEKVHNDFLRKITLARKSTPLYMLYGELGRIPMKLIVKSRMIGYWNRVIKSKGTKFSFLAYQFLLHTPNFSSEWITYIQSIFNQIGRPDIWQLQENVQSKSLSKLTKRILTEQFIQEWRAKDSQSHKALVYFNFKQNFELEKYFTSLPRKLYLLLFKLRTANHKLPVEIGRWEGTDRNDRICSLCDTRDIGDEFHYIFQCAYFESERTNLIKPYFLRRPSMYKFGQLVRTSSEAILKKLCKFIQIIFDKFR